MTKIRVKWPKGELVASLDDTLTAKALVAALPAKSRANTWGHSARYGTTIHFFAGLAFIALGVDQPGFPSTRRRWLRS